MGRVQCTNGKIRTNVTRDDRGSILIIAAAIVIILVLLFVALSEYGRYLIMREQTQTAADAAALAGASGVIRYVTIEVVTERGSEEECEPDNDGGWDCYCVSCGTVRKEVTGTETELIDEEKWKDYVWPPCDCGGYQMRFKAPPFRAGDIRCPPRMEVQKCISSES